MAPKFRRILDPIHGLIEFERDGFEATCWQIIESRQFQRLRRVKQLGFSEFVYPGATHSRFTHSVGVFHTARKLDRVIESIHGDRFDKRRAQMAMAAHSDDRDQSFQRIATSVTRVRDGAVGCCF